MRNENKKLQVYRPLFNLLSKLQDHQPFVAYRGLLEQHLAKISTLKSKGIIKKIPNERRVYESVDDNNLS